MVTRPGCLMGMSADCSTIQQTCSGFGNVLPFFYFVRCNLHCKITLVSIMNRKLLTTAWNAIENLLEAGII